MNLAYRWTGEEIMMDSKKAGALMMALFLFSGVLGARESTCVDCHTNDAKMKSLFVPPVSSGSEEGEG
jgi:hypothetical protein